jgi:hypothetical protein
MSGGWALEAGVAGGGAAPGKAVQVDPFKPTLKAPGTKRLTLKSDELLSNFAFKFSFRRYTQVFWLMMATSLSWSIWMPTFFWVSVAAAFLLFK